MHSVIVTVLQCVLLWSVLEVGATSQHARRSRNAPCPTPKGASKVKAPRKAGLCSEQAIRNFTSKTVLQYAREFATWSGPPDWALLQPKEYTDVAWGG